jgi:putative redox protein
VAEVRRTAPVHARWLGGYRATVTARQFRVEGDEPPCAGGDDTGPMPTEYLLISLASCYALAIAHVARRDGIEVGSFGVTAQGIYAGPSLSDLELTVHLDGPAPPDLDDLLERAGRVCYVSNTLSRQPAIVVRAAE